MENGQKIEVVVIHNRYGNPIEFLRLSENHFLMRGGQWIRMGTDANTTYEENKYIFTDPSGGPYISQGMTMAYVNQNWMGKIVRYCSWANKVDELKDQELKDNDVLIVTYPERLQLARVNGKAEFRIYSGDGELVKTTENLQSGIDAIEEMNNERR